MSAIECFVNFKQLPKCTCGFMTEDFVRRVTDFALDIHGFYYY